MSRSSMLTVISMQRQTAPGSLGNSTVGGGRQVEAHLIGSEAFLPYRNRRRQLEDFLLTLCVDVVLCDTVLQAGRILSGVA